MPTITIFKDDLESLLTGDRSAVRGVSMAQLEEWLMLVKGELKGHSHETGELRIELQDSNRPDLWCCEGIARQIRIKQQGRLKPYSFFAEKPKSPHKLIVKPGMEQVRPYVAACTARGYLVTEKGLAQLIQTQEKLAHGLAFFGIEFFVKFIGTFRQCPTYTTQFFVGFGRDNASIAAFK